MASPTWWTWVWGSSGNWWWRGKPGLLLSMGLQTVGYDWATELTDSVKCHFITKKHRINWYTSIDIIFVMCCIVLCSDIQKYKQGYTPGGMHSLESPKDRGAWWAMIHRLSRVGHYLSDLAHSTLHTHRMNFFIHSLLVGMSSRYQLCPSDLMCHLRLVFPY